MLESGIHLGTDIVKEVYYFLIVFLSLRLLDCQSLSYIVKRLCKVRYLSHIFQFVQSEDDLLLHLLPLSFVIQQEELYFPDNFVLALANIVLLYLKRSLNIPKQQVSIFELAVCFFLLLTYH